MGEALQSNPELVLDKVERWVEGFQRLIPNILVALVVLAIFVALGWMVQKGLRRWGRRSDRANLGDVLGSFVKWVVIILGLLLGLIIVLPTFRPDDLIAGLGIGSVAIGFAFKNILQNWLAGLLLLIRRPIRIGDEIVVNGYEGKVEWIEARVTMIRTYDGRRAIIPNADVFTNAVTVNTTFESVARNTTWASATAKGSPPPARPSSPLFRAGRATGAAASARSSSAACRTPGRR